MTVKLADENGAAVIKTVHGIDITYDKRAGKFMATLGSKRVGYKDIRAVERLIDAEHNPIRAMSLSYGDPAVIVNVTNLHAGMFQGYEVGQKRLQSTTWKQNYYRLWSYDADIEAKINDIAERSKALRHEYTALIQAARYLTHEEVRNKDKSNGR